MVIHAISLHELFYPAYRLESESGKDLEAGLSLIGELAEAYKTLRLACNFLGIKKVKIIPLTLEDIVEAYSLILDHRDLFIEERGGYWPGVADAIVAAT
ncbi:MAG: hypothetical protein QI197_08280 [Candidatus Korarchaeota archaeon]|nr:hypothetical protein [Candidatus Korarchaeota archaeon]